MSMTDQYACWYDQYLMAKELLEKGANANCTNMNGLSPLHRVYDRRTAELLLHYGANSRLLDCNKESPADWAVKERRWDVLEVLTNAPSDGRRTILQRLGSRLNIQQISD